jgi:hypothetical protein
MVMASMTVSASAQDMSCPGALTCVPEVMPEKFRQRHVDWGGTPEEALEKARQTVSWASAFYFGDFNRLPSSQERPSWFDSFAEQNAAKAFRSVSEQQAYIPDVFALGLMVGKGSYQHPHSACLAVVWLAESARRGRSMSMAALSHLHLVGFGVERNAALAYAFWRQAVTIMMSDGDGLEDFPVMGVLERAFVKESVAAAEWLESARAIRPHTERPRLPIAIEPPVFNRDQCPGFDPNQGSG